MAGELSDIVERVATNRAPNSPNVSASSPGPSASPVQPQAPPVQPPNAPPLDEWRNFPDWDPNRQVAFLIAHFAPGPRVPVSLTPTRIEQRARGGIPCVPAGIIVNAANALVARTNPRLDPNTITIVGLGACPVVGEHAWWAQVFNKAVIHGPRMLAALILTIFDQARVPMTGLEDEIGQLLQELNRLPDPPFTKGS